LASSEKALERYGAAQAAKRGIYAVKLGVLGGGGWPDHTFFKGGVVGFIEYKKSKDSAFQPLQKFYLNLLQKLGFRAEVCWTREQVDQFMEEFGNEIQASRVSGESPGADDGQGPTGSTPRSGDGEDRDVP